MAFTVWNSALMNNAQQEVREFITELEKDSDRAVAIVGAALIEGQLGEIAEQMRSSTDRDNRRYESLGSLIEWAAKLQLISDVIQHDLDVIRKIRNVFAHSRDIRLDFSKQVITELIAKFKFAQDRPDYPALQDRCKYEDTIQCIGVDLLALLGASRPANPGEKITGEKLTGMKLRASAMEDFVDIKLVT